MLWGNIVSVWTLEDDVFDIERSHRGPTFSLNYTFSRFHEVGMWRKGSGNQVWGSLSRPVFPDIVDVYRNFQGRQLLVTSVDNWPFFELRYMENGTVAARSGIDVSVVNTLSYYLNFT